MRLAATVCVVWNAGCGIILGVDDLTEVPCVGPCLEGGDGRSAATMDMDTGADVLFDGLEAQDGLDAFTGDASTDTGRDSSAADALPDRLAAGDGADAFAGEEATEAAGLDSSATDALADRVDAGVVVQSCIQDLSNIGQADFHISFNITTIQQAAQAAVINQRSACSSQSFWDVRMKAGKFLFESADPYVSFNSTVAVNDGVDHAVLITRTSGSLAIFVDSKPAGSYNADAAAATSFGLLPALEMASDPCGSDGGDGTVAFVGTIANVCISSP